MKSSLDMEMQHHRPLPLFKRRSLGGDRGQSLIELALTLPLFILILVGATEFGRFAWATIEASNAARAGAQYRYPESHHCCEYGGNPGGSPERWCQSHWFDGHGESVLRLFHGDVDPDHVFRQPAAIELPYPCDLAGIRHGQYGCHGHTVGAVSWVAVFVYCARARGHGG